MSVITITLPEQIRNRLKTVDNQSALISKLLSEYFEKNISSLEDLELKKLEMEEKYYKEKEKILKLIEMKEQEQENKKMDSERLERIKKIKEEGQEELRKILLDELKKQNTQD